jgi:nucleotide-binding universal stress UspA family protein
MKTMMLAASMTVLVAISGQALAGTAAAEAWHRAHAAASTTAMHAYDAVPATAQPDVHRYHGGPKVND